MGRYGPGDVMRELTNDVEFWLGSGAKPTEIAATLRAKAFELESVVPEEATSQHSDHWPAKALGHDANDIQIDEAIGVTLEGKVAKPKQITDETPTSPP
jgi:predicted amino acid dehydrogenase